MASDLLGEIIVIKRNGSDGARFPLKAKQCTFGRDPECDIRIQIPQVEKEHAKIYFENGKIWLQNFSNTLPTLLNSEAVSLKEVNNNDVFTITQRSFRFEFPERRKSSTPRRQSSSKKTPLRAVQGSPRTPTAKESLKNSITKLRRDSKAVLEENEKNVSPVLSPRQSARVTPVCQKENTPENDALSPAPSILKKKGSAKMSDRKRISFGPTLSPELFDKTLPPSTPLRKGTTPARRLSEPLQKVTPRKMGLKRCSLGTALGKMPIMEEEEEIKEERAISFCDTPPVNLSTPLMPAPSVVDSQLVNTEEETSDSVSKGDCAVDEEAITPKKKRKQGLLVKEHRLATPLRRQIHSGMQLQATKRRMTTPLRREIECKPKLRRRSKKVDLPRSKDVESKPCMKAIQKRLATPIRASIQKGVSLRATKKKLQTPLREEIKKGMALRETKPKLPTPLRNEIKSNPVLKETKRRMRRSLQDEITQGKELRSKFAGLKQMPGELKEDIARGKELNKLMKSAPTPLRNEVRGGVTLRETKKKMRQSLQDGIVKGRGLRKTKLSAPTPLRKAIKEGTKLRKTKQTAPTPLREAIKKGVTLRKTKKKLNEGVQAEIKQGRVLKKTKPSAPTPFKNEIKRGIKLRPTKQTIDSNLKEEIEKGKQLKKTKRSAPTPFKNEIKKGVKLRVTKKRLSQSLQNEIKSGTTLAPLMRKALKTPIRMQIKSGVRLRQSKKMQAMTSEGRTESDKTPIKVVSKDVNCEKASSIKKSASDNQNDTGRPVLRAKRRLAARNQSIPITALEIPRKLPEKIEKPAKKRICRRSTPKKMAELRDDLQARDADYEDLVIVGTKIDTSQVTALLSPAIAFDGNNGKQSCQPETICSDSYLSETSCEDLTDMAEIPGLSEPLVHSDSTEIENIDSKMPMNASRTVESDQLEVTDNLALKRLLKTPKAAKRHGAVEEKLGLKRLMKTPNTKEGSAPVQEHFGLKRIMTTPKTKTGNAAEVASKLGLKRLMQTPKERTKEHILLEGDLGLQRLMGLPKSKNDAVCSPHLDGIFYEMRDRRTKVPSVTENLGLRRLLRTPKDKSNRAARKYSLDAGSLSAVFKLPKDAQDAVEDMQLQDFFVDVEHCEFDTQLTDSVSERKETDDVAVEQQSTGRATRRGKKNAASGVASSRSARASRRSKFPLVTVPENGSGIEESSVCEPPQCVSGPIDASSDELDAEVVKSEESVANVPSKITRRSDAAPKQSRKTRSSVALLDDVSKVEEVIEASEAVDKVAVLPLTTQPVRTRSTRASQGGARRNTSTSKRGTSSTEEANEPANAIPVAAMKQEDGEIAIEGVGAAMTRSKRLKGKRKPVERIVEEEAEKKVQVAEDTHKSTEEELASVNDDAGVAKETVETPPKAVDRKCVLDSIQEEAESQRDTPFETSALNASVAAVNMTRNTRGRGKRALKSEQVVGSDDSSVKQATESVTAPRTRKTRSKKEEASISAAIPENAGSGEVEKSKPATRKRVTKTAADKHTASSADASVEEAAPKEKRRKRAAATPEPTIEPERRSTRLRTR